MNNKIRSVLSLFGFKDTDFANFMGMSKASYSNKRSRSSWTASDLINLAEFTGNRLAIINDEGKVIMIFDKEDIKKEPTHE